MVPLRRVATAACAGLVLALCGVLVSKSATGDAETDRQSATLADAIGYPPQSDAIGFARAALDTPLGKTGTFSVLQAEDLEHEDPDDPMARLVWRIHRDAYDSGWKSTPAFDACYSVDFNYYGAVSKPSPMTCPDNATPITPPPLPKRNIPPDFSPALEATLGTLPETPGEAEVRAALAAGLPTPPVDPVTNLAGIPPQVLIRVRGSDVGVALLAHTGGSKDCVLGRRVGGAVRVWSLNWRDLGPLEKPCSPEAALGS
ncbi:hypothetical protein ALI22I_20845 [Saccharothrix sp. ALI-22-I]|uniref:hypothetical protein n=1 Tax=Saccharothrix sp. ALI-22-I TaxID=1933778 RepID=UPI00097BC04B|nr:hypothetical protein [Saccharothrix sp. ALI-22-I]ONI87793.1 hypothetical protein ALI22I_20845 [Saccharothrix sp. ALI-22-I]